MKKTIIILILLIFSKQLISQQNPPSILWKAIKTEHFEIIFPDRIEIDAQTIANTLEHVYKYDTTTIKANVKPLSVILHNQSNISNAYAALMPRRMAWYLTPPQSVTNLGSGDWYQNLAIHEFRHIVQYQKNKKHFTKFASILFGDIGQSLARWTIPDWFFEGDAICMETALSNSGRGRIPAFSMYIRNNLLENTKFTYDQAYLRSYKRFYPNHYYLGYQLTAYGRTKYGANFWDKVLERTNKRSYWPFAFNRSIKKYTGLRIRKFYQAAMVDLKTEWQTQDENTKKTEYKTINSTKKRSWTNYYNPKYDENGNIICEKQSLNKISAFYKIYPDGKEKKIKNTDATIFEYANNKIVWETTDPDIRWDEKNYTNIVLLDLKTKKEKKITKKAKYLSPSLSPDATKIAAIEHTQGQETYLVIIDANTAKEITSVQVKNNEYIRAPRWSEDGEKIVFTHAKTKGSAVSIFNVKTEKISQILPHSFENIGKPFFYKKYIIYNSPYSGIGNIYAVDIKTKEKFRITSSKYGAYNACISKDLSKLAYQNYNKSGFDIVEIDIDTDKWQKIDEIKVYKPSYVKKITKQETGSSIFNKPIPNKEYEVTKYKKYKDAIKIHSWGIFPSGATTLDAGIISSNYLNTLNIVGGYLYNIDEKTHGGYLGVVYSKYFPMVSVVSSYNQRTSNSDTWNELKINSKIHLPFNFSHGIYDISMNVGLGAEYTHIENRNRIYYTQLDNGNFTPLYTDFSISRLRPKAWRDFNPMFGQTASVTYKKIMDYDDFDGYVFSSNAKIYFPGILPHNSIKLKASYEEQFTYRQGTNIYYFSSMLKFPRGFEPTILDKIYKYSADYQLPLWYPDFSVGPLAYLKRIKLGAFYDYADGYLADTHQNYQSVGGSISFKINFFRIKYDFEIGVQYAYKLDGSDPDFSITIAGLPF